MKARDESVPLPALSDSLADSGRVILQAMADERLTPEEAAHILQALSTQAPIVETAELEQRIVALEAKQHGRP